MTYHDTIIMFDTVALCYLCYMPLSALNIFCPLPKYKKCVPSIQASKTWIAADVWLELSIPLLCLSIVPSLSVVPKDSMGIKYLKALGWPMMRHTYHAETFSPPYTISAQGSLVPPVFLPVCMCMHNRRVKTKRHVSFCRCITTTCLCS
jgi:hypothetical protein